MGLMDSVKSALGRGEDEEDEIPGDPEWGSDVTVEEEEGGDIDDEFAVEEEEEQQLDETWDSAYDFVGDHVTKAGFADMVDFIDHCMFRKIDQSPMYRDRLQNGVNTMNQVTSVKSSIEEVRGSSDMSLKDKAEKVEAANNLMDEMDKLNGEDEAFVREAMGIARDLADGIKENGGIQQGQSEANITSEDTGERL